MRGGCVLPGSALSCSCTRGSKRSASPHSCRSCSALAPDDKPWSSVTDVDMEPTYSSNLPGFSSDGHIGGAQFQPGSYITFWVHFTTHHLSITPYGISRQLCGTACSCLGECVVALCTPMSLLLPSPFLPVKNSVKVWKRTGPIGSREPLATDSSDLFPEASLTFTGLP